MAFSEARQKSGYGAWMCNARLYKPCERNPMLENNDLYEAFYHKKLVKDNDLQFDLCIDCAKKYKKWDEV